jgi:O-antigen ligase
MLHFWVLIYIAAIYVRPGEIIPSLANVPIVNYLSAGGLVLSLLSLALDPRRFWDQPHDKAMLLYWVAIAVSNPAWGYLAGGPEAISNFFPVVFFYFLIRLGVRTHKQIVRVVNLFIWLNVFLAVNGLMQVYTGAGFGQVEALDTREGIRIQGTGIFNDPNDLGMTLVMALAFVLNRVFGQGSRFFTRLTGLVILAALLAACFYTNSRGTMLGIGAVLAMFAYRRFGLSAAGIIGTVGLVGLLALGPSRMSNVSSEEASAQGRIQAWSAGMQMFKESPLTGVGYRRFGDIHGLVAHNAFVHVLGELGFFGASAFVAMFYWFFRRLPPAAADAALRIQRLPQEFIASGIGLCVCITFLSRQYVAVPFLLIALGACYASATTSQRDESTGTHVVMILGLTTALVVIFYLMARFLGSWG